MPGCSQMRHQEVILHAREALAAGDRSGLREITSKHVHLTETDAEFALLRASAVITTEPAEAARLAKHAACIAPDSPETLTEAAGILLHTGHPQDAARCAAKAALLAPDDFAMYSDLAYVEGAIADLDRRDAEAERKFREAVAGEPEHPVFVRRLAVFLASRGRMSEAIAFLTDTLVRSPNNSAAQRTKADLEAIQRESGG
jgi:Flp pilus assembly protein TadD